VTLYPPLWAQNTKYPAALDRLVFSTTLDGGVFATTDLQVGQRGAGTNMSVDVAAGRCVIPGPSGSYLCVSDDVLNRPVASPPAVNNSRVDLVCATVTDNQATGVGDPSTPASWDIQVVTGTPATSNPQAPALPANSVPLARIVVTSTSAVVTNAMLREARTYADRASRGLIGSVSTTSDMTVSASAYTPVPGGALTLNVIGHRYIWFAWGGVITAAVAGAISDGYVQVNGTSISRTYLTNRAAAAGGPGQNSKVGQGYAVLDPGTYTVRMVARNQYAGNSTWWGGFTLNCFDEGAAPATTPPVIPSPTGQLTLLAADAPAAEPAPAMAWEA